MILVVLPTNKAFSLRLSSFLVINKERLFQRFSNANIKSRFDERIDTRKYRVRKEGRKAMIKI